MNKINTYKMKYRFINKFHLNILIFKIYCRIIKILKYHKIQIIN